MTPFRYDHDFRAPSTALVLQAYFDPELAAEQDRRVDLARREVLEHDDRPDQLRRVCNVVPKRQLPALVRPFIAGDLRYREEVVWKKAEDVIVIHVEPAVLSGRIEIVSNYRVQLTSPGVVHRVYDGHVSVQIRLVGGRVERAIIDDLEHSLGVTAKCTQEWLDVHGG